jgi:hypothetical protein
MRFAQQDERLRLQGRAYPHKFDNNENLALPECPGVPGPYREFPIRADGTTFVDGTDPKTDRIVYKTQPGDGLVPSGFKFCGVITHLGAQNNRFLDCPYVG